MGKMEEFFLIGSQVNEIEIKELLLRRYGRYDFPDMKFEEFIDFIVLAITMDRQDKVREEYLVLLPMLIKGGHYMTFDKFYEEATGSNIDWRPSEDILKEAEQIQERFKNGS